MSQLGQTASITLITAVPGSGKTLRAVWYMRQAVEQGMQVFCCNVNGLDIPQVIDFPDPTKWEDLPPNSVLIVDECQKFFRAGREVPAYIAAMETIRHMGIRLILLTQHPALIHPNIRALVGFHEHLVRENGKESVTVFTRSRVIDNVRSDKALAVEDHHTWSYPKECYDLYKSAEVHTVKRTVPYKYKRAALLAVVAAALLGFVVYTVRSSLAEEEAKAAATEAVTRGTAPVAAGAASKERPEITTASDYAKQVQPLVSDAPWTAPAFVNRPMLSDPKLYCMSAGTMKGKTWNSEECHCVTEQGTRYQLDHATCVDVARYGPRYNPYTAPVLEQQQPSAEQKPSVERAQPSAVGVGNESLANAGYGAMRDRVLPNSGSHIKGFD